MHYYNEIDPYAAEWLRNLIAAGHLPAGHVDTRSILDVSGNDLRDYVQCHFFAGIGGWPLALKLADWPVDRPVWTGSCPCQPFSVAGAGAGFGDERHLWPYWHYLIEQRRPRVVFGEQVEAAIKHGWLDLVQTDLEGIGYAFAAVGVPAAGVGAPHARHRLWFVADDNRIASRQGCALDGGRDTRSDAKPRAGLSSGSSAVDRLENSDGRNAEQHARERTRPGKTESGRPCSEPIGRSVSSSPWHELEWLECRDGKRRPTKPGLFPLAHGVPARVGKLRGAGNAIVPQAAAEVIRAYMGC